MQSNSRNLENYRFAFKYYLEAAGKLVELERGFCRCMEFSEFLKNGCPFEEKDQILYLKFSARDVGSFLAKHYGFHSYSKKEFDSCLMQLRAEIDKLKSREESLWEELKDAVNRIDVHEWADNQIESWFLDNASKQHMLLRKDQLSKDRIDYYKRELERYDRKPLSPSMLEIDFRCCNGGLIYLVPITNA